MSSQTSPAFSLFGEFTLLGAVFAWLDHSRGLGDATSGLGDLNDLVVLQYAGLEDMDGEEIYEGDRVSMWYAPRAVATGHITFESGAFYFNTTEAKPNTELLHKCATDYGNHFRVTGSKYDRYEQEGLDY